VQPILLFHTLPTSIASFQPRAPVQYGLWCHRYAEPCSFPAPYSNTSKESGLKLVSSQPRCSFLRRTHTVTPPLVTYVPTAPSKQASAFIILCSVTSHASDRVARFLGFNVPEDIRSEPGLYVAFSLCSQNERALSINASHITCVH
jgi:hypothetical protein